MDNAIMKTRPYLIILAIILLGLSLRIHGIASRSYWVDEEQSIRNSVTGGLVRGLGHETHPPLYYVILNIWMRIFGQSELSTRALSALFGTASILLIFKIGSALFGRWTGTISAFLLAVSATHIMHSQEARMYALMSMLALMSMHFFIGMIRDGKTAAYIISTALLLYTHIYGFFILLAQVIYVLSWERRRLKLLRPQLIVAAAFLPWVMVLCVQVLKIKTGQITNIDWIAPPTLESIYGSFRYYVYYNNFTLFLFSLLAVSQLFKGKNRGLLLLWLLLPVLVPFFISKLLFPIYMPKYTIACSLAFYILSSAGICMLRNKPLRVIAVLALGYLSLTGVESYYSSHDPEPWRDVAEFIDNAAGYADSVAVLPDYARESFVRYSHRTDLNVTAAGTDPHRGWVVIRHGTEGMRFGNITVLDYTGDQSHISKIY
ncbi:MAG: glycosyltransferase family 39 protein [archaeon]